MCISRLSLLTFLIICPSASEEICVRMYRDGSRSWSWFSSRNDRLSQRRPSLLLLLLLNRRLRQRSKHIVRVVLLLVSIVILESYPAMVWVIADEKVVWLFRWSSVAQGLLVSEEACVRDIRVIILHWSSEWI